MVFTIARRYRGARHLVPPRRMFPSVASSARPVRWRRPPPSVTSATRVFTPVREMTPRSHAFCRPSPRTPCGGVASFEARTARLMAAASVEGGSSGNCFSERAWAEQRRVKGTRPEDALARAAGGSVLPSSMRGSSTPCHRRPGTPPVWRPGPPRLRRPRLPTFRAPAKGSGRRAARVLGSLRKYVNERGIAPTARPPDLRSRGPREVGFAIDRPAPF